MGMEIVAIVRKNTKIWESAKINLFPYRINVTILTLSSEDDMNALVRNVEKIVARAREPVLIINEIPHIPKLLPKGYIKSFLLPATSASSLSLVRFIQKTIAWYYKKEEPPRVFVFGLPEVTNFLSEFGFPIVELKSADFVISSVVRPDFPDDDIIILPFPETVESFIRFMTELLYNYVSADVVKEKMDAEAEITRRAREALLQRRRKKGK